MSSPNEMIAEMMFISMWSKKEAKAILNTIIDKLDPAGCPKLTLKILSDLEFYCDHCSIFIDEATMLRMDDVRNEAYSS